jgi:hypothetical protein
VITSEPEAFGVKFTEQLEVVALIATRVHGLGELKVPAVLLNSAVPAGALVVPAAEVSLTKALHDEA